MLKYKFLKNQNGRKYYCYYPDGNFDDEGIVGIGENDDFDIEKISKTDVHRRYAIHALYGIDTNKTDGTVAWY